MTGIPAVPVGARPINAVKVCDDAFNRGFDTVRIRLDTSQCPATAFTCPSTLISRVSGHNRVAGIVKQTRIGVSTAQKPLNIGINLAFYSNSEVVNRSKAGSVFSILALCGVNRRITSVDLLTNQTKQRRTSLVQNSRQIPIQGFNNLDRKSVV